MLTTQIQVLLYLGNTQIVSCSVFVPIPSIVVKSHQTLEAILPYLPLSLTAANPDPNDSQQQQQQQQQQLPALEDDSNSSSVEPSSPTSLVLSTRASHADLRLQSRSSHHHHHHHSHSQRDNASSSALVSSNRISPDSSIPATTCIKISLQPTPTFRFVKPKCPHLHQKNRNQRHYKQQQQQQQQQQQASHQQQQQASSASAHSRHSHSHSRSHRHTTSANTNNNNNTPMASLEYSAPTRRSSSRSSSSTSSFDMTATTGPPTTTTTPGTTTLNNIHTTTTATISLQFYYPFHGTSPAPHTVQVTGTFNNWRRTAPLVRNEETAQFEGQVTVPLDSILQQQLVEQHLVGTDHPKSTKRRGSSSSSSSSTLRKKILFKFVLNQGEQWVTDPEQELERDQAGNLNNVFFLDTLLPTATTASTTTAPAAASSSSSSSSSPSSMTTPTSEVLVPVSSCPIVVDAPLIQESKAVSAPVTTETKDKAVLRDEQESEEERVTRLKKQEEEDDATIRALGGGMWGAPYFAVNDPVDLPEHFATAASPTPLEINSVHADVVEIDAPVAATHVVIPAENLVENPLSLSLSDAVVELMTMSEPEVVAPLTTKDEVVKETEGVSVAQEEVEQNHVEEKNENEKEEETQTLVRIQEDEDEDDKIIREFGGGLWGTPFFKVNDPVHLPEHFVEALAATHPDVNIAALASVSTDPSEMATATKMEEEEKNLSVSPSVPAESRLKTMQVVEDEVEPTIAIATATSTSTTVTATVTTMTMTKTHSSSITEGPGVEAKSLHILTTAIQPVGRGESFIVEPSPEMIVHHPEFPVPVIEDAATPQVDESVNLDLGPKLEASSTSHSVVDAALALAPAVTTSTMATDNSTSNHSTISATSTANTSRESLPSSVHGDDHDGDGDYGVVLLQGQPVVSPSSLSHDTIALLAGPHSHSEMAALSIKAAAVTAVSVAATGDAKPTLNLATTGTTFVETLIHKVSDEKKQQQLQAPPPQQDKQDRRNSSSGSSHSSSRSSHGRVPSTIESTNTTNVASSTATSSSVLTVASQKKITQAGGLEKKKSLWRKLKKVF